MGVECARKLLRMLVEMRFKQPRYWILSNPTDLMPQWEVLVVMKRKHARRNASSHTEMTLVNGIQKTNGLSSGTSSMVANATVSISGYFQFPIGQRWTFGITSAVKASHCLNSILLVNAR